eukprot:GFUD01042673.1.p1 GENE.GFUD01042673.1~~GFUD01042673.1.p1  ORF type:complete len:457 (+),score=91.19 GFUD01042673.1:208-1578(+)
MRILNSQMETSEELHGHKVPFPLKPLHPRSQSKPFPKIPRKSKQPEKKKQKKVNDPPSNPFGYKFDDQDQSPLDPNSKEFMRKFTTKEKVAQKTKVARDLEFARFEKYVVRSEIGGQEVFAKILSSKLKATTVAELLSLYIRDRVNLNIYEEEGVVQYLDTTTMEKIFSLLCNALVERTTYRPAGDPDFNIAREAKVTYLVLAKRVPGLGQLAHQALPLSRAQVDFLLHSDILSWYSPRGLTALFYIEFALFFGPRVKTEIYNVTRGDFRRIKNKDGSVRCVVYVPQGQLKKDRGDKPGNRNSGAYKRPAALSCKTEPKLDFSRTLGQMEEHCDQLPWEGDRSTQPLFYQLKTSLTMPGECFFLPKRMGEAVFDSTLKWAILTSGLDTSGISLCNSALRTTAFNLMDLLGFSTEAMMAFAGHTSDNTNRIYRRNNYEKQAMIGGAIQEMATGEPVV